MNEKEFWQSISVLINNYHAVNKNVFACVIKEISLVSSDEKESPFSNESTKISSDLSFYNEEFLLNHLRNYENIGKINGYIISFNFLTKNSTCPLEVTGILDFRNKTYSCKFPINTFNSFHIIFKSGTISIVVDGTNTDKEMNERWSDFVLKPKLLNWCKNKPKLYEGKSLQLVNLECYNSLYIKMKKKYGASVMELWKNSKESTDPLKYIYEDIAIAAYLITLWSYNENGINSPKAFADIGCGNGLLVYLLNQEGYNGYGYDVRARKIWSLYPSNIKLIEQTIDPYSFQLPSDVDWIIGNHSDELTPWIPVLAVLNNYNTKYFLLPCCGYEFSGCKFQRRNSNISAYQDLLNYVRHISLLCGFRQYNDRLKIPSTKRMALIGLDRLYNINDQEIKTKQIWNYIKEERTKHSKDSTQIMKFRERTEVVRNCTQIEKTIIDNLVFKIFSMLLTTNYQNLVHNEWRIGGQLQMSEIVKRLSNDNLKHIKSECGGVKTLLRNNHAIFEFKGDNMISIRRPVALNDSTRLPKTIRKRACFFKQHHPDGCPLTDEQCSYIH